MMMIIVFESVQSSSVRLRLTQVQVQVASRLIEAIAGRKTNIETMFAGKLG